MSLKMSHLAQHDPMTGLPNRLLLHDRLGRAIASARRRASALAVLFLDVDRFKRINDRFGHATGDDVLREIARLVLFALREREVCVRYGGEELLAVLEGSDERRAAGIAERLREAIERHDWARLSAGLKVTLSCGVAEHQAEEPQRPWLERADAALYAAKHAGRNRVVAASALPQARRKSSR